MSRYIVGTSAILPVSQHDSSIIGLIFGLGPLDPLFDVLPLDVPRLHHAVGIVRVCRAQVEVVRPIGNEHGHDLLAGRLLADDATAGPRVLQAVTKQQEARLGQ